MHQNCRHKVVRFSMRGNSLLIGRRPKQGIESGSGNRRQLTINLTAKPVVISMESCTNNAFDAIRCGRLDGQITAALFHRTSQVCRVTIICDNIIAEPFRQCPPICNSRLSEPKQSADLGSVALDGAAGDHDRHC